MDDKTRTELEAAAFRTLVQHLRERTDVQNIDLMNLAGFCRNCLSRWYREAAEQRGVALADAAAREIVYGMPRRRNCPRATSTDGSVTGAERRTGAQRLAPLPALG